jgi:hypothetical protein
MAETLEAGKEPESLYPEQKKKPHKSRKFQKRALLEHG